MGGGVDGICHEMSPMRNGNKKLALPGMRFSGTAADPETQRTRSEDIVIGIAAIVPRNAIADSLMEEISMFMEENCDAEILEETQEIR